MSDEQREEKIRGEDHVKEEGVKASSGRRKENT